MATTKVLLALSWIPFSCQLVAAQLEVISNGCICIGEEVVLQCTTSGNGFTLYNVTGCLLSLPHTGINGQPAVQECTSTTGAHIIATAQSVTNGGAFVSVLNITSFPNASIKVECYHEVDSNKNPIGNMTLKPAILLPPDNITLLSTNPPIFNWKRPSLPSGCQVQYKINSSNCGTCPSSVSDTMVTCESVVSTTENYCQFFIRAVICGGTVKSAVQTFIASESFDISVTNHDLPTIQPSNGLSVAGTVIVVITIVLILILIAVITTVIICCIISRKSRVKGKPQTTQGLKDEDTDAGSDMKSLICELRSEMQSMREFQQQFKEKLEEKDNELVRKNQEIEKKNHTISENQKKIEENIEEMQKVKGENERLIHRMKTLEEENLRLKEENQQLRSEAIDLRAIVETINQEKSELLELQKAVQKLNNEKASQEDVDKIQQKLQAVLEMPHNDHTKNLKPQQTTLLASEESKTSRIPTALRGGDSLEGHVLLTNASQTSYMKEGVHSFKNPGHVEEASDDSVKPERTCCSISDDNNSTPV